MNVLTRLRQAHPDLEIKAYDGHHARIGEDESHLLSYVTVIIDGVEHSFRAEPDGRRKPLKPAAILSRLSDLITNTKT